MEKTIVTIFLILSLLSLKAQKKIDPDFILQNGMTVPKVMLVGSWHFNYPGLDAYKVEDSEKINIYSEKRQKELNDLIKYIARFKPTKIVVESGRNTGYLLNNFKKYKKGEEQLYANERSQIGMRLVDKFKLDTIYGVDAYPLILELNDKKDTLIPKSYIDSILVRHYFGGSDKIQKRYTKFSENNTKITLNNTLLESFKYLNSKKVIDRYFGAYISGGQFESKKFEGPDALSMFWMNRNLRIFKNIKSINYSKDDRILVIFGLAHIPILKWFFECSPEFEVTEFSSL